MNENIPLSSDADNVEPEKTLSRKEKLKLKKKSRKKRLRQEEYTEKSKIEEEEQDEKKKFDVPLLPDAALISNSSVALNEESEGEEEEDPRERKRVCVIHIINEQKEPKQHHGLRCSKCFLLLAKDEDFKHYSNHIWIDPRVLQKRGLYNLKVKNDVVYCKNMHNIGRLEFSSFVNERIPIYRIKIPKTTFVENYVNKYIYLL